MAALSALGAFLTHPAPGQLPATTGMLDNEIEALKADYVSAEASLQACFETLMEAIDDLEATAQAVSIQ